ncbi:hypothetical protein [Cupriavidus sp. DL-D2]|uniref:hypothetical protein n=1 Tax=Cupriavidus sp. DL-D2 TaxID=3144974 RepID=UPI003212426F
MIRARFYVNANDPRPVVWPIPHPYWVTGYGDDYAIVVAYADDEAQILRQWPEATKIDIHERDAVGYKFTERFPLPEWFKERA